MLRHADARSGHAPPGDEENPYLVSFSDLMAALLLIFILSLASALISLNTSMQKLSESIESVTNGEDYRRELLENMQIRLQADGIAVEVAEDSSVLRIPDGQLTFRSGMAEVDPRYRDALVTIGSRMYEAIKNTKPEAERYLATIFIEGHTDSVPFAGDPRGNWGLSTDRAVRVWRFWTEDPATVPQLRDLVNRDGRPLFSMSGYGHTRPVVMNERSDEDKQKNRRIDVRFVLRSVEADELTAVKTGFLGVTSP